MLFRSTPSLSVHPAEALHGNLGRVTREDVIKTPCPCEGFNREETQ